jgi:deazaflavin-dependent oxidoreductase (nitroreductase family)
MVPRMPRHTHTFGRFLSASQLPYFQLRPPQDYGVLTTTGHKTGKRRARCVRVVRRGDRAYLVAIGGNRNHWARNILATPEVGLRLRDGRFKGTARVIPPGEADEARAAYSADVHWFERLEWRVWRKGSFTAEGSRDLHRHWFDSGLPFLVELRVDG